MCSSDEDPLGAVRLAADALGEASRHVPPAAPAAVQALRAVLAAAEETHKGPRSTPFAWRGGGLQVASPAQRAARLAEWSAEVGVDTGGGIVVPSAAEGIPGGCGIVATRPIPNGTVVCEVPRRVMINSGRGGRGPLLRAAAAAAPLVDKVPSLGLVLRLLQECHRGEGSPWRGYLESLPPLLPAEGGFGVPLAFGTEALAALEGSAAGDAAVRQLADFARQYAVARAAMEAAEDGVDEAKRWPLLWEEFVWASAIVMTRQNPLPPDFLVKGSIDELALMPFLDYMNHAPTELGGGSVDYEAERCGANVATGCRGVAPGTEVRICYGERPSDHLFLYGGFVDVAPAYDRLQLRVSLQADGADVSLSEEAERAFGGLLKWLDVPAEGTLDLSGTGRPGERLARWLVAVVAARESAEAAMDVMREVVGARAGVDAKGGMGRARLIQFRAKLMPRSKEAELLARLCRAAAGKLPEQSDTEQGDAAWDMALAKKMVRHERKLLKRCIVWCEGAK